MHPMHFMRVNKSKNILTTKNSATEMKFLNNKFGKINRWVKKQILDKI